MKTVELLDKANRGYRDGFLATYYDERTGEPIQGSGDSLAEFIVCELRETFDEGLSDEEQIEESIRALVTARNDIDNVIAALHQE